MLHNRCQACKHGRQAGLRGVTDPLVHCVTDRGDLKKWIQTLRKGKNSNGLWYIKKWSKALKKDYSSLYCFRRNRQKKAIVEYLLKLHRLALFLKWSQAVFHLKPLEIAEIEWSSINCSACSNESLFCRWIHSVFSIEKFFSHDAVIGGPRLNIDATMLSSFVRLKYACEVYSNPWLLWSCNLSAAFSFASGA